MYLLYSSWQFMECGTEGSILVLSTLLEHMHYHREDVKNTQLELVLMSIFKILFNRPNFSTVLCQSLRSLEISEELLEYFSSVLCLPLCEKIGIGLALCDLENHEIRIVAKKFCVTQIEELCSNPVPMNSTEQIQNIVMFLQRSVGLSNHLDHFLQGQGTS
ncbi:hypothetical protein M5689_004997 [Euphorbia peplus]|nr:hypothetical protein M5689_004997 [Euphorbia peplus]